MANNPPKQKIVVIGAGPVGALSAIYAAQRGHDVEVYELRNDLRDPSTTPLNFTKSINLALSERGINAMRESGRPQLLGKMFSQTIPMKGRMIHGKTLTGEFYEQSQEYDIHGRTIFAVDRGELNKIMLDELESMPNVKFFFNHKLTGADFKDKNAWFEVSNGKRKTSPGARNQEIEVAFDLLIGADGAHSAARYHLMKFTHMDYQQEYIEDLWCEFTIPPKSTNDGDLSLFAISPNHLHIWPGQSFMFIAIPSNDGSFTCTLFMPAKYFRDLEIKMAKSAESLTEFFDSHFPGVTSLINSQDLITSFNKNSKLPLISIKCQPHHYQDAAVIVGDAAHAMVPFYGQGMNAGLEDVRVLFSFLDKDPSTALAAYSEFRIADAHVINDLALQNYTEMRASVTSPTYKFRKWLEEMLSVYVPSLGWQTKYSRVSFGNERYSEVVRKSERQGRLLVMGLVGMVTAPAVVGALGLWYRWGSAGQKGIMGWWGLGLGTARPLRLLVSQLSDACRLLAPRNQA